MKKIYTDDVKKIYTLLDNNVRIVGGSIRDFLLNHQFDDIDFATPLIPDIVTQLLSQDSEIKIIEHWKHYGTITAIINKKHYQITTLREDILPFARHTQVAFTSSYEKDAQRRDFTINALYADDNKKIYDFVNGLQDISTKTIRFIGEPKLRIQEDPLRILRFFRFWSRISDHIPNPHILDACSKLHTCLSSISIERKKSELFKILQTPKVITSLKYMRDTHVLDELIPSAHISNLEEFITSNPNTEAIIKYAVLSQKISFPLTRKEKQTIKMWFS